MINLQFVVQKSRHNANNIANHLGFVYICTVYRKVTFLSISNNVAKHLCTTLTCKIKVSSLNLNPQYIILDSELIHLLPISHFKDSHLAPLLGTPTTIDVVHKSLRIHNCYTRPLIQLDAAFVSTRSEISLDLRLKVSYMCLPPYFLPFIA